MLSSGVECIRGQSHTATFILCLKLTFLDKLTLASHDTCRSAFTIF